MYFVAFKGQCFSLYVKKYLSKNIRDGTTLSFKHSILSKFSVHFFFLLFPASDCTVDKDREQTTVQGSENDAKCQKEDASTCQF